MYTAFGCIVAVQCAHVIPGWPEPLSYCVAATSCVPALPYCTHWTKPCSSSSRHQAQMLGRRKAGQVFAGIQSLTYARGPTILCCVRHMGHISQDRWKLIHEDSDLVCWLCWLKVAAERVHWSQGACNDDRYTFPSLTLKIDMWFTSNIYPKTVNT